MSKYSFILVSCFYFLQAQSQIIDKSIFGIGIRYGFCQGKIPSSNLLTDYPIYLTGALGFTYLIKMKPASTHRALIPYLRTELSFAHRAGQFDSNNSLSRFATNSIDFTALVPLTAKINDGTYFYLSAGTNLSFNVSTRSNPENQSSVMPTLKFGLVSEVGFSYTGERITSLFGVRSLSETSDYSFNEFSIFYSICGRKRKKDSSN